MSKYIAPNGGYLIASLFVEGYQEKNATKPIATLKEYPIEFEGTLLPSAYMLYMSCKTDYEFSQKLLGSFQHFKKLLEWPLFKKHYDLWQEERVAKEYTEMLSTLKEGFHKYQYDKEGEVIGSDPNVQAIKEYRSIIEGKNTAGRPKKAQPKATSSKSQKSSTAQHLKSMSLALKNRES